MVIWNTLTYNARLYVAAVPGAVSVLWLHEGAANAQAFIGAAVDAENLLRFDHVWSTTGVNLAGYAWMLNPLGFVPQSFQVVPGIVPDHRGPSVPHRPITRQSLGVGDSDFVITVVGSVGPRKNQLLAVQAVCAASRMAPMPHVRLVLLGTMQVAAYTDQLTDAAQLCEGAQVLFKGHVPHANVSAYLAVADLHLSTSTAEVAPVNVFEALMAGVPVLMTEAGASATDGVPRTVLPLDSAVPWAQAIVQHVQHPLGPAARQRLQTEMLALAERYRAETDVALRMLQAAAVEQRV